MSTLVTAVPASRKQIWLTGFLLLPLTLIALGLVPALWAHTYLEDRARTAYAEASLVAAEPVSPICAYGFTVGGAAYRAEGSCAYLPQTHSPVPTVTVEYAPGNPRNSTFAGPSAAADWLFLLVLPLFLLGLTVVLTWLRDLTALSRG